MFFSPDLRILFPTSYSDACFRTARALAQLADTCRVHLTIAHVAESGETAIQTRRELHSFLAEADHYDRCHRVLLNSDDPATALNELSSSERFDLIMAPASDRLGLHSLFAPSLRARLLKQSTVPLWTAGRCLDRRSFQQPIRTVACLIDFDADTQNYIAAVVAFAARYQARVRVLHVLPSIDEGTLARSAGSDAPLMPEPAIRKILSAFEACPSPEVDVAIGQQAPELRRMLSRCDADLLFVGPGQALRGMWRPKLASYLDRLPCPVICMDGGSASFSRWSFQDIPSHRVLAAPQDYVIAS
jgi:nucleotide-binding universal stress UspA family protein